MKTNENGSIAADDLETKAEKVQQEKYPEFITEVNENVKILFEKAQKNKSENTILFIASHCADGSSDVAQLGGLSGQHGNLVRSLVKMAEKDESFEDVILEAAERICDRGIRRQAQKTAPSLDDLITEMRRRGIL